MKTTTDEMEKEEVINIMARVFAIDPSTITLDARMEDLAEDSVQLFALILAFEEYYSTQIEYDDLVSIDTVGDVVSYVSMQKLKHTPPHTSHISALIFEDPADVPALWDRRGVPTSM